MEAAALYVAVAFAVVFVVFLYGLDGPDRFRYVTHHRYTS